MLVGMRSLSARGTVAVTILTAIPSMRAYPSMPIGHRSACASRPTANPPTPTPTATATATPKPTATATRADFLARVGGYGKRSVSKPEGGVACGRVI